MHSIMLPNGTLITNPEQFEDYEAETVEVFFEDSTEQPTSRKESKSRRV